MTVARMDDGLSNTPGHLKNHRGTGARNRETLSARKPDIKRMFIAAPECRFGISLPREIGENI